jgi:radical SAM superfamily enzyme YgiQ (UPF0313 family)
MKPQVLLIQPPIEDFYTTPIRFFPLGLLQIATSVQNAGYKVNILDCLKNAKKKSIILPKKYNYIKKYYDESNKSPFRLFSKYYHFGMSWEEIYRQIERYSPDIVGVASSFSPYYEYAIKCAQITKEINKKIITVIGGAHASVMPETLLKSGFVDFVIKGEAEYAFVKLLESIVKNQKDKIDIGKGILFCNDGFIDGNNDYNVVKDLNELPLNDLTLVKENNDSLSMAMIQTSRGCPMKCNFCSTPSSPCGSYRVKTPEKVSEEILYYKNNFDITHIDIEDDNFTADYERSLQILDFAAKNAKVKLSAMNGLAGVFLNKVLLDKMKEAGFSKINLSVVTTDLEVNKKIERKGSFLHLENIIRYADSLGMEVETHFIIGIPGEEKESTMNTLLFLMGMPTKIGGSIFYPVPGTALYDICIKNGWIINNDDPSFWRLTLASVESYKKARGDQITFLYLVRIVNFVKEMLKKYSIQNKVMSLNESIFLLYKFETTQRESLGLEILRRFLETEKIWKAVKIKEKYILKEENMLNNDLISRFLSEPRNIEF